eukprot:TRINITY_DN65798_c1_g1_i1.p2 TRINITY_DN65798_c1_g1~~TRINITY_DN65798_c1_g1_i1.p2  ORF type:complete len:253 (-),score=106.47 TRINITY_DN65798_c1_g1_i1:329-1087(-)
MTRRRRRSRRKSGDGGDEDEQKSNKRRSKRQRNRRRPRSSNKNQQQHEVQQQQQQQRPKRSRKEKGAEAFQRALEQSRVLQQVNKRRAVVRRIPSHVTEDMFRESVEPFASSIVRMRFVRGREVPAKPQEGRPGVAYLSFHSTQDLNSFAVKYGTVRHFRDSDGRQWPVQVEFAPSQADGAVGVVDGEDGDELAGTIEDDEKYKEFLQLLADPAKYRAALREAATATERQEEGVSEYDRGMLKHSVASVQVR